MLEKKQLQLLDSIYSTIPELMDYEFEERVEILHSKTNIDKVEIEEYLLTLHNPEIQYKYEYETG